MPLSATASGPRTRKLTTLFLLLLLAPVIASIYGMLHDQLTYTISPEYYTKFKFEQFGVGQGVTAVPDRVFVSLVGIMATWWMGIPIGLILGLTGLIHKDATTMFLITTKAFLITMVIAFTTGLLGLLYARLFLFGNSGSLGEYWYIPEGLNDPDAFIMEGSMHNFSYLGGLAGLVAGIVYSINKSTARNLEAVSMVKAFGQSPVFIRELRLYSGRNR
jgi:hypothetical protein